MKKTIGLGMAVFASLLLLTACGGDKKTNDSSSDKASSASSSMMEESSMMGSSDTAIANYTDGTYKVEAKEFDENGWKEHVELVIKDGKISEVTYDAVDKDGKLKTADATYKEKMQAASKTYPEKYTKELADQLIKTQNVNEVEVVTGATHSSENFKKLAEEALMFAEKGETGTHTLDLGK